MKHPVGVYRRLPLAIHPALVNIKSGGLARGNFENVCLCRGVIDRRDDVGAVGAIPLESARKHFFLFGQSVLQRLNLRLLMFQGFLLCCH